MARSAKIEGRIAADPEAPEGYLVYADWLQSRGDPRGEWVALQAAAEFNPSLAVERRIARLADRHGPDLLGPLLHDDDNFAHDLRFGFVRSMRMLYARRNPSEDRRTALRHLQKVLDHPVGPFLRELEVGSTPNRYAGDLRGLLPLLPRLRSLRITGLARLGELHLTELRELSIDTEISMPRELMSALARAPWPRLEALDLRFGAPWHAEVSHRDILALLARPELRLERLKLRDCHVADQLCQELPDLPVLTSLRELEISGGISKDGASALLDRAEAFSHLHRLRFDEHFLGDQAHALLAGLSRHVEIGVPYAA